MQIENYDVDFSHKINHLSYGKQEDFKTIQEKFADLGVLNPLDGLEIKAENNSDGKKISL